MFNKRIILGLMLISMVLLSGCTSKKIANYTSGRIDEPTVSYNPPTYSFSPIQCDNPEYNLPLSELPENYQRDIVNKFNKRLSQEQIDTLMQNGVVIIPGEDDRFEEAYMKLSHARGLDLTDREGVPIFITTDSIMHLFHIQFNELLKNIEINKLTPMLDEFLEKTIDESVAQYSGMENDYLKELSRRNIAYLAVAKKLLDPGYDVPGFVKKDVELEINRIEEHNGLFKSELFSMDCPPVCSDRLFPARADYACNQKIKGKIMYEGKEWDFQDLYVEVCAKSCYCEDYSQYVPRGHYTSSEGLKRYFKSMMWLGRMTFKANGEDWTKQAVLLTDSVKSANTIELWNKIYTVTGFFAGASDDLTFYEYDTAIFNLFNYGFDEGEELSQQITERMQSELRKQRGPEILGGFEFDVAGNLKDTTQGLRLIGQRYAIDSQILSDLVYSNVGVNPESEYYEMVLDAATLSKDKEFYRSCDNMAQDTVKYWNEVCDGAMQLYHQERLTEDNLYNVCRYMPSGLDVMSVLGSTRADEILGQKKMDSFCGYTKKITELKNTVNEYSQEKWTENLYNTWLWMIQPVLDDKPGGYPNWMRSKMWKNKELITALSSWAQLRHDTILYVKQSYTKVTMERTASAEIMSSRYYGYVEPNPELFARAKFITEYLIKGLEEQGVMTEDVKQSLKQSRNLMDRLQVISEKELRGEALDENDYRYIETIDETFNMIIENLASALTVETNSRPSLFFETHKALAGKDSALKTTMIADVHTETNTKKALEVGTGKIDWVIVAHASKDGRIGIAVGPMFSYYEFPWAMSDRLTDEKWRNEVIYEVERPDWVSSYIY